MTALVPILVAVFNALAALGPKVMDLFAQVRASPDLQPDAAKMLDGLEKSIDGHVDYLDRREPIRPVPHAGSPELVPEPKPTAR